ncbi:MAG: 50S ribosomal protein L29 [bacterium]|nr:50S ribosomal protein L29 [bacterium]MDA1024564.1 50S ribosomal protein L29 [bacterium]
MEYKDLEKKTIEELEGMIEEKRAELYNLRTKDSIGQLKQNHLFGVIRKEIARIKTRITELNNAQTE